MSHVTLQCFRSAFKQLIDIHDDEGKKASGEDVLKGVLQHMAVPSSQAVASSTREPTKLQLPNRCRPGETCTREDFIPIQSVPSSSSPLLQLQELFTIAGRTAAFVSKKPTLGAGLRGFRQCRIPLCAKLAMRIVWFVGSLALGTSPLLPGFGHGLTPSSLGGGPQISCQKLELVGLDWSSRKVIENYRVNRVHKLGNGARPIEAGVALFHEPVRGIHIIES